MIIRLEKFASKWWGMLILVSVPIFLVLSPVLVGGYNFIMPESDRFQQGFYFIKDAIARGDSIFWNPYVFSGFPTFASTSPGYFNPLVYFGLKYFPVSFVYNWLLFLYFVLAAFFTALLLKKIKVNTWAALAGGIIFVFSQWAYNFDLTIAVNMFLLPLFILFLLELKRAGWRKYLLLIFTGMIILGLAWFSSFWHFLIEALVAIGLFVVFDFFVDLMSDRKQIGQRFSTLFKNSYKKYLRAPIGFVLMVGGGTLVGLFQLVPALTFLSFSPRAEQFTRLEAITNGFNWYDLIGNLLPYFNFPLMARSADRVDYWGILPLFFIIIAFCLRPVKFALKSKINPNYLVFFTLLFLMSVLLAIDYSPLFWLFHHLPPINLLHEASRWLFIGSFAAAMLAAFGIDLLLANFETVRKSGRLKIAVKIFYWLTIAIGVVSLVCLAVRYVFWDKALDALYLLFNKFIYPSTSGLGLQYYHDYLLSLFFGLIDSFNPANPQFFIPFLFLIVALIFFWLYLEGAFTPRKFAGYTTILISLNFILVYAFNDNISRHYELGQPNSSVAFLQRQPAGRIFSALRFLAPIKLGAINAYDINDLEQREELKANLLFPNKNVPFKIASIDAEGDPMVNKSMSKLITYLGGAASLPKAEKLENLELSAEEKAKILEFHKPILDFLGVKYLVSVGIFSEQIFPKVFETKVTPRQIPVAIFENRQARPLYYFTDEEWLLNLDEKITIEELNQRLKESGGKITQEGINFIEHKNNLLILETKTPDEQLLVFSQNNLPGWQAYIDNQLAPIYNVGTIYMGVLVSEGEHQIYFRYSYWETWKKFLKN